MEEARVQAGRAATAALSSSFLHSQNSHPSSANGPASTRRKGFWLWCRESCGANAEAFLTSEPNGPLCLLPAHPCTADPRLCQRGGRSSASLPAPQPLTQTEGQKPHSWPLSRGRRTVVSASAEMLEPLSFGGPFAARNQARCSWQPSSGMLPPLNPAQDAPRNTCRV